VLTDDHMQRMWA